MHTTRLDRLLSVRASLRPGEVITVLAPVAGELASLHRHGEAHGAVSLTAIGLDTQGRPRLLERPDGGGASPDADVRALAALVTELTGPYPPDALVRVARDGADGLYGAAGLQAALLATCRAEPVRLPRTLTPDGETIAESVAPPADLFGSWRGTRPGGMPVPRPSVRRPVWAPVRRFGRAAAVGAVVLLVVAVGFGIAEAGAPRADAPDGAKPSASQPAATATAQPSPAPRSTSAATSTPGWRSTLRALDRQRSAAFARGDADLLRRVYTKASDALAADLETLRAYRHRGLRVRGLHLELIDVRERSTSGSTARLTVTDRLDGYRLVDTDGGVVRREPGRGAVTWRMTMRSVDGGWRIAAIDRVGG